MSINNNATYKDNNWTTQKFVSLSNNLGQAYCPGSDNTKANKKADFWTTDKLISMSRYLSYAYGVDF